MALHFFLPKIDNVNKSLYIWHVDALKKNIKTLYELYLNEGNSPRFQVRCVKELRPLTEIFCRKARIDEDNILGENDHDPNWGKAIKFKPEGVTTIVKDIEWNIGKTGELTPIAILESVDLDGSTVSKASLYNAGYVVNNEIQSGTKVRIAKAGDIIPQIIEIFK